MKPNRTTIFKIDFCIFCLLAGIILICFIILAVSNLVDINNPENDEFIGFRIYIQDIFIFYNLLKSAAGIVLFTIALLNKKLSLTRQKIFTTTNIIYIIILFLILLFCQFNADNINKNYNEIMYGFTVSISLLYKAAVGNLIINMIGIPMWYVYIFDKCEIGEKLKKYYNIITRIFIIFSNFISLLFISAD